ncbi:esterase B1-like [Rhagoletis pomonella]|uniref:esterase B1-like n=1 Tax=Rhagoletis pomonella TaxID=28610 RepID=UPI00177FDB85|nr:esterase B1-like [Rhagoletis pomonella]
MMTEVIFISIGFRLGALGFLSFPEPELQVPGNASLKDIYLALQWIKHNCHNFNGDPSNITLYGHSSGSSAAHMLMMAPKCETLFHKVILMSGTQMHIPKTPDLEYRFAKHLGYEGERDNRKILAYLMSLEAERLSDLQIWTPGEQEQCLFYVFSITIESETSPDALITKDPLDIFVDKQAWSNNIPIVMGSNSFESLMHYKYFTQNPKLYDTLRLHPEYLMSLEVRDKCDLSTKQQLARKLIRLHLGAKELCVEQAFEVMHMNSYDFMYHPIHRFLQSRLANATAHTYLYRFDFDSADFNLFRIKHCGHGLRGVSHVDELSYIFLLPTSFKLKRDSKEFQMIECMVNWITKFAATSNPNGENIKPLVWMPLKPAEPRYCLNISDKLSFIEWPEAKICAEWDHYYKEAGLRLF